MTAPPPPSGAAPEPGPTAPRTCYRHSDRETGVSCTRCERPICPDCMVEASVGFQCPRCVAEGNRTVRRTRTPFGGRTVTKPYVTWTLLGLMAAGFIAQLGTSDPIGQAGASGLIREFAMLGLGRLEDGTLRGVMAGEWYRLITAAFLHGSIFHLLFNGYALYVLGTQLERWLGHGRFLALWVVGALSGSVLSLLVAPVQFSVGASGAIFALFGAVLVIGKRLGLDLRMVLVLMGVNLVLTFVVPNISWTAHIGGLVAGLAVGAVFAYLPGRSAKASTRTLTHALLVAGFAALLVVLVVAAPVIVLG